MINIIVPIKKIYPDAIVPLYATEKAAGLDLHAYILPKDATYMQDDSPCISIGPGQRHTIGIGLAMQIPDGYEMQVRPRSGLAHKHGITVTNSPGTIDGDFRGEVKVILQNTGNAILIVKHRDRIAQGVFSEIVQALMPVVDELDDTIRGTQGFGHTGV